MAQLAPLVVVAEVGPSAPVADTQAEVDSDDPKAGWRRRSTSRRRASMIRLKCWKVLTAAFSPSLTSEVAISTSVGCRVSADRDRSAGKISSLNTLAAEHGAKAIIHTGDFGFYESASLERIADRTLKHLVQYSTLITPAQRTQLLGSDPNKGPANPTAATPSPLRTQILNSSTPLLSEFSLFLDGTMRLDVPVFTVWGACEDVAVLEKFRTGEYVIPNLHVLDEATTRAIDVGGVKLRLFGLGGAVVLHKLFDNGQGNATIAGGQGTMWTTVLQIGELIDTAQKVYDPTETRLLITHASPGREGLLAQLALALKADLTISAGLHFRYGVSYNEFSVQHDADNFRNKLVAAKVAFGEVWETVKSQVEQVIDDNQKILLHNALAVTNRLAPASVPGGPVSEEPAWKNTWNWNLPDAAYGSLVLDIQDGRISAETKSQGFNFAYRRNNQGPQPASTPVAIAPVQATPPVSTAPVRSPQSQPPLQQHQQSQQQSFSPAASAAARREPPWAARERANGSSTSTNGAPASNNNTNGLSPKRELKAAPPKKDRKPGTDGGNSAGSRSDIESPKPVASAPAAPAKKSATLCLSNFGEIVPVTDVEIKAYFGDAASGVTKVKLVFGNEPKKSDASATSGGEQTEGEGGSKSGKSERVRVQRGTAYVDFTDEAAMQAGLEKSGATLKSANGECVPTLKIAPSLEEKKAQQATATGTANKGKSPQRGAGAGATAGTGSGAEKSGDEGSRKSGAKSRGGQKKRGGAPAAA